jgi:acetyl-CoA acetyltransferase
VREAVQRSGIEGGEVDEVILGNVLSVGLGQAPARQATIRGGLSATLPAVTVNKVCGSGLKAVMLTAQAIRAGDARVIMASGARDMVTLLSAMADRDVRTGLATMCLGGGNAVAMSVARTPGGGVRP